MVLHMEEVSRGEDGESGGVGVRAHGIRGRSGCGKDEREEEPTVNQIVQQPHSNCSFDFTRNEKHRCDGTRKKGLDTEIVGLNYSMHR
ncbi:hypothetical protein VNO78_07844 [Psophocarpus tetragonolobus]|uniref:Uncharacterized protein n=1 Tax=Psophocarpus tetragonolobus TaxID=3891 RepID=A0AAN9XST2_PSOTE